MYVNMKPILVLKISIDIAMTIIMLLLMAYVFIGNRQHMWLGMAEFILYIAHNILNRKWYTGLFKGRYNRARVIRTVINIGVFAAMIGLMVSGVILSNAFGIVRINAGRFFSRQLHMLSSYWGFILMSLHLGINWNLILGIFKRHVKTLTKSQIIIFRIIAGIVAVLGIFAFIENEIITYMLLIREFAGFDLTKGLGWFIGEYVLIMGTCIFIAHYGVNISFKNIKLKKYAAKKKRSGFNKYFEKTR